jgi:hypothetical protein
VKEATMGRRLLIVFLAIGAVLGFAAGIRGVHHHGGHWSHWHHREELEAHVADVCLAAARRATAVETPKASPD